MASHKSAQKRARQTVRRTARNTALLSQVRTAVRRFRDALKQNDGEQLKATFQAATRELRRVASKGVLHANNASRRVSRLAHAYKGAVEK